MSLLTDKLNQDATWEQSSGSGGYGPTYGAAQPIKVRFQFNEEKRRDANGEEYTSNAQVWMESRPAINDRINYNGQAFYVREIGDLVGLDGDRIGWKAMTGARAR